MEKIEIIIGKYDNNFCWNYVKGLFKCFIPPRNNIIIKMRVRTDTTFCRRNIDLIGVKGVFNKIFQ